MEFLILEVIVIVISLLIYLFLLLETTAPLSVLRNMLFQISKICKHPYIL